MNHGNRDVLHQNAPFHEATAPCGIAYNYARIRRLVRPGGVPEQYAVGYSTVDHAGRTGGQPGAG